MKTVYPALLAVLLLATSGHAPLLHAQQAQQADQPTQLQQFQHIEDGWSEAYIKKDQYAMELLLAPSFVDISGAGTVETRNQYIAEIFAHVEGEMLSMEQRAVNVRVLSDIALVQGTYVVHYRANSHNIDERGIYTHVYQRARTTWVCVSAQRTVVYDQSDEKHKKTGSKQSNASEPFHVPLLYKGSDPKQQPQTTPTPAPQP